MTKLVQEKILSAIGECEAHIQRMEGADARLKPHIPFTVQSLPTMGDDQVATLDQFIYRFTKLQDALGTRLFPAMATLVIGDDERRPFLDTLNRLEKANVLTSVETWQSLRVLRNTLAHDYPDGLEQCVEALNLLFSRWVELKNIFRTARTYYEERLQPLLARDE